MKLSELIKKLKKGNCTFVEHGTRHDVWRSPDGVEFRVPRHAKEIATGTANSILKDAGLK